MNIKEVSRMQVFGEIVAALAKLARDLDGPDPIGRKEAQQTCMSELRPFVREDEAMQLVRIVSERRIVCRECNEVYPQSRCTGPLCLEHARRAYARAEWAAQ